MSDATTIGQVQQWEPDIAAAAAPFNLPGLAAAAEAIMAIESNGDPNVGCSPSNACGLMQVVGGSNDPTTSINQGVSHLAGNYQQCHTWEGAAAAYFSGSCDTSSAAQDSFGTSVSGYVSRFDQYLSEFGGAPGTGATSPAGTAAQASVSAADLSALLTKGLKSSGLYLAAIGLIVAGVLIVW